MSDGLAEIESLGLESLSAEGKPPKESRLNDASVIRFLYQDLVRDDQDSAVKRVRVQAMIDGEPPYDQARLNATGQGSRANANFLMGQDLVNKASNGYLDIITSVKTLVSVEVDEGEPSQRANYCQIIAQELSRTIRKWPGFTSCFLRLVREFVSHGVGIAYFPDAIDFRFEVAGLGEFLIPRQTRAEEDKITYGIARRDMTVTDLYAPIRNEEAAAKIGWNVPAVKAAIGRATTKSSDGEVGEIEKWQKQVKNNDLQANRQFSHVPVLYCWVQEFDGTITFAMTEKDAPEGEFLFIERNRYKSAEEAYLFFCYGIGNGTYHSIRGMGYMIYALVQLHNRLMCQKADGVMMDESIMIQAQSANAMQNATLNYMGPFSFLDQGFDVIDRKTSASSERTLPFLNEVKGTMGQLSNRFMAPSGGRSDEPYQNELSTEASLEAATDSGAIDLFYVALDRLYREMVRRIVKGHKSDKLVAEFHRRCERAGVTEEILASMDHDSTYAVRALGAGSPAARQLAFAKLLRILPQLDEIGRKNLIYQFVSNAVGYQNADTYASAAATPRLGVEAGIAESENFLLAQGADIVVFPEQMHATHIQIHLPKVMEMLDAVERGLLDPLENLGGLQAFLDHIAAHGEALAQDPTQDSLYKEVKEAINNLQQVVTNMERKIRAMERDAGTSAEGGQVAPGSEEEVANTKLLIEQKKLALAEFKLQLAQAKGEMELAAQQSKISQSLALNDLKAAEQAEKALRFPGTTYGERR